MYAKSFLATFALLASVIMTDARATTPRARRQLGNLLGGIELGGFGSIGCNIARLDIVGALGDTEDNIADIQDPDTQAAAQAGLDQANDGIGQIAQAILSGEAPPQEGRDEVETGLAAIGEALESGDQYVFSNETFFAFQRSFYLC